jgi:hypothetical protein
MDTWQRKGGENGLHRREEAGWVAQDVGIGTEYSLRLVLNSEQVFGGGGLKLD